MVTCEVARIGGMMVVEDLADGVDKFVHGEDRLVDVVVNMKSRAKGKAVLQESGHIFYICHGLFVLALTRHA